MVWAIFEGYPGHASRRISVRLTDGRSMRDPASALRAAL